MTVTSRVVALGLAAGVLAAGVRQLERPLQASGGLSQREPGSVMARRHGRAPQLLKHNQDGARQGRSWRHDHQPGKEDAVTFPHWTGSFSRDGVTYPYTMVGTDPGRGSATTTVKVVLIPLRLVYPDGGVYDTGADLVDGMTAVQGMLQSPVFQPYDFVTGGHRLGPTQWVDAFQRATFWPDVSTVARNYHIRLTPSVAPTVTLSIPEDDWWILCHDDACNTYENALAWDTLSGPAKSIFQNLGLRPDTLPVFVTGPAALVQSEESFALGFTNLEPSATVEPGMAPFVWIAADYISSNASLFSTFPDAGILAHELLHWVTNPFFTNEAPPWTPANVAGGWCSDDHFNVPDPVESSPMRVLSGTALPYHVPDGVLPEWYSHARRGSAVNGAYSFWGDVTTPSGPCVDNTAIDYDEFDGAPGALYTSANDINDRGDVVGIYFDAQSQFHGFRRQNGRTIEVARPGGMFTQPFFIANDGTIVGSYSDGAIEHGFVETGQLFVDIDVPNAVATYPVGIDRWGDIAGTYIDGATLLAHGFVLRHGIVTRFDVPGAVQTGINALNDQAHLAVNTFDAAGNQLGAFIQTETDLVPVSFPGGTHATGAFTLDDRDRVAGGFTVDGATVNDGFVTRTDGSYQRLFQAVVNGMNNVGQVVGTRKGHGFVARLPNGR